MPLSFNDFMRDPDQISENANGFSNRELLLLMLEVVVHNHGNINQLREQVKTMSTTIATRADLDAGIDALLAAEAARDAVVTKALNDLTAKIASGVVTTPADFTAELAKIATLQTNAATLTSTATADDPGPITVPTTPIAPPAGAASGTTGTGTTGTGSTGTGTTGTGTTTGT